MTKRREASPGKKSRNYKQYRTPQKEDRQAAGNLDNLTAIPWEKEAPKMRRGVDLSTVADAQNGKRWQGMHTTAKTILALKRALFKCCFES